MERKKLTKLDACRLVGVGEATLRGWIRCRKVEITHENGATLVFEDSLFRTSDGKYMKWGLDGRRTLSILKVCDLLGVSRRTVYNWLEAGKVEYVRTAGGSVRIFVDTLAHNPRYLPIIESFLSR